MNITWNQWLLHWRHSCLCSVHIIKWQCDWFHIMHSNCHYILGWRRNICIKVPLQMRTNSVFFFSRMHFRTMFLVHLLRFLLYAICTKMVYFIMCVIVDIFIFFKFSCKKTMSWKDESCFLKIKCFHHLEIGNIEIYIQIHHHCLL